jgi:hypothetical protein
MLRRLALQQLCCDSSPTDRAVSRHTKYPGSSEPCNTSTLIERLHGATRPRAAIVELMDDDFTHSWRSRLIQMVSDYQLSADSLTENFPISYEAAEQILDHTAGPREQLRDWLITQLETPGGNPDSTAEPIPEPLAVAAPSIGIELTWMSQRLSTPAKDLLVSLVTESDESLQAIEVNLAPLDLRYELAHHQLVTGSQGNVQLTSLGRAVAVRLTAD